MPFGRQASQWDGGTSAHQIRVQEDGLSRRSIGKQGWWLSNWLSSTTPNVMMAGAELGLWNFLATSCQVRHLPITPRTAQWPLELHYVCASQLHLQSIPALALPDEDPVSALRGHSLQFGAL